MESELLSFVIEYLSEIKTESCLQGAPLTYNHEKKNEGRKSCETLPLSTVNFVEPVLVKY